MEDRDVIVVPWLDMARIDRDREALDDVGAEHDAPEVRAGDDLLIHEPRSGQREEERDACGPEPPLAEDARARLAVQQRRRAHHHRQEERRHEFGHEAEEEIQHHREDVPAAARGRG